AQGVAVLFCSRGLPGDLGGGDRVVGVGGGENAGGFLHAQGDEGQALRLVVAKISQGVGWGRRG
ncbi:L-arabinose ABC transporter ATP-binding protein AraG, partial [Escherichia coli]|nr:L-arabinose ABC transporter ATP-binding protein AraG [Escherichia coli]